MEGSSIKLNPVCILIRQAAHKGSNLGVTAPSGRWWPTPHDEKTLACQPPRGIFAREKAALES